MCQILNEKLNFLHSAKETFIGRLYDVGVVIWIIHLVRTEKVLKS